MDNKLLRILTKTITIITLVLMMIIFFAGGVFADSNVEGDSAGNLFAADENITINEDVPNELYLAGNQVSAGKIGIGNNVFVAGKDVTLKGTNVKGTAFLAGKNVSIDTKVGYNIWAAGYSVIFEKGTKAKSAAAAAQRIEASGTYKNVKLAAKDVYFDANVDGDVSIEAENVEFGPNAKVTGKADVEALEEPTINGNSKIKNLNFTKKETSDTVYGDNSGEFREESTVQSVIKSLLYWIAAYIIIVIILRVVFNGAVNHATEMTLKKPVPMLITGALSLIVIPVVLIMICISYIGLPTAGIIGLIVLPIIICAKAFTFIVLGQLMFNKIRPDFSPIVTSIVAVIACVLICKIPYVGGVVGFACEVFALGYFVQLAYEQIKSYEKKHKERKALKQTEIASE